MNCTNCRAEIKVGAKFCGKCGTAVSGIIAVPDDNKKKVDMYMMMNQKFFPEEKAIFMKDKLYKIDDEKLSYVSTVSMKDPMTMLLISIFVGALGVDRFMFGEIGMGVLKLLTGGCLGILTIYDWFTITKKTKEHNFNNVMNYINYY